MITPDYLQMKEESQLILSRFAHEIRNPLSIISSELQLLSDVHPEITEYKDWDMILNNLNYIEDLLKDFSSYGTASQLTLTPTKLSDYLNELVQTIKPSLEYLNIQLDISIPENLPSIPLDQRKFRQAFLNFIRNAQEAVPSSNGRILISCESLPEQKISISICDNGCGLKEEQLSNVFTPFVTYKPGGTGLGLSISRQIIAAHGGTISLQNNPDQGCTLRILLGG